MQHRRAAGDSGPYGRIPKHFVGADVLIRPLVADWGFVRAQKKRAEARPLSVIVVSFAGDDIDHAVLFKVNDSVSVVNPPAPHAAEIFF